MAERARAEKRGDATDVIRTSAADLRRTYARISVAADSIHQLLDEKRMLATGKDREEDARAVGDMATRVGDALEDIRRWLFESEEKLMKLENLMLDPIQREAYTQGRRQGPGGDGRPRDESAHVPALQDLAELESETGVADITGYRRTRATVLFTLQPP